MVLHRQFQYILSTYSEPPMVLRRQLKYILSISYQPTMVLHRQFQRLFTAKFNTPDQQQATIKQAKYY